MKARKTETGKAAETAKEMTKTITAGILMDRNVMMTMTKTAGLLPVIINHQDMMIMKAGALRKEIAVAMTVIAIIVAAGTIPAVTDTDREDTMSMKTDPEECRAADVNLKIMTGADRKAAGTTGTRNMAITEVREIHLPVMKATPVIMETAMDILTGMTGTAVTAIAEEILHTIQMKAVTQETGVIPATGIKEL